MQTPFAWTYVVSLVVLTGCVDVQDKPNVNGVSPGTEYWFLPKTTVRVDVSFALKSCEPKVVVVATPKITVTPVVDYSEKHFLIIQNLEGWFTSNELDVERYPNGTLKSLGAKPQDQTATIVGNVLKSATDIAKLVLAEKTPTTEPISCSGTALTTTKQLQSLQKKVDANPADKNASSSTAMIANLQQSITINKSVELVTGDETNPPISGVNEPVPIVLSAGEMQKAGWLRSTADPSKPIAQINPTWINPTGSSAVPPIKDKTLYHYREPLPLTLKLVDPFNPAAPVVTQDISFAQWGTPRVLPITAPIFGTLDWTYTFAEDGTPTSMKVSTSARGVAASSLLNSATGTATSIQANAHTAATANSELSQLQDQDALIKAKVNLINDTKTLKGLGGVP